MIYLIGQLSIWLLLAAVSAGFAGVAYAAHRGAPARQALRRERDRLVRDLGRLAIGEGGGGDPDADRARAEAEAGLTRVRESRIAELENALEHARDRADEATAEAAELRRQLDGVETNADELDRLRALSATLEQQRAREIEAEVQPVVEDDAVALQAWRLRYFEQRVRYLEDRAAQGVVAPVAPLSAPATEQEMLPEWQAREALARAAFLEEELRNFSAAASAAPEAQDAAPFAADADVDVLLRWRLLYLERRVAHLQTQAASSSAAQQPVLAPPQADTAPDPDRWKWRARYLESRVRHLEQRPVATAPVAAPLLQAVSAPEEPARAAAPPATRRAKPPVLAAARNGAPDDLTLIESISQMQQTTLYALGVFHFEQIAAWTPEHVAWVDQYLRLRGRIGDEEWLEQAEDLARGGPAAARRALEEQD